MTEDEFWDSTPSEIERRQWVFMEGLKADVKKNQALAWRIASLSRQKRLPSLHVYLNPARPPTPEERIERQAEFDELRKLMER